jgi:uncharacterized protein YegP (UPF0339 family)
MSLNPCQADTPNSAIVGIDGPSSMLTPAASIVKRRLKEAQSRFDIYRADHVRLTSTQFGGGDWHWRLTGASGSVIADCGGYRDEAQCLAAVNAMRSEARLASIFME